MAKIDWVTITPVSGASGETIVTIVPDENNTLSARNITLKVSTGMNGKDEDITISQKPATAVVIPKNIYLRWSGAAKYATVISSVDWQLLPSENWLYVSSTTGHSGTSIISITADEYSGSTERTGEIVLSASGYTSVINVVQSEKISVETSENYYEVVKAGDIDYIDITSNGAWEIQAPSWVILSSTSGTGNETITIEIGPNTGNTRNEPIIIKTVDEEIYVNIYQYGQPTEITYYSTKKITLENSYYYPQYNSHTFSSGVGKIVFDNGIETVGNLLDTNPAIGGQFDGLKYIVFPEGIKRASLPSLYATGDSFSGVSLPDGVKQSDYHFRRPNIIYPSSISIMSVETSPGVDNNIIYNGTVEEFKKIKILGNFTYASCSDGDIFNSGETITIKYYAQLQITVNPAPEISHTFSDGVGTLVYRGLRIRIPKFTNQIVSKIELPHNWDDKGNNPDYPNPYAPFSGCSCEVIKYNGTKKEFGISMSQNTLLGSSINRIECNDGVIDLTNANIVRYYAPSKLPDSNSTLETGIYTGSSQDPQFGQELISHTFNNGVGTLTFNSPVTRIGSYAFNKCSSITGLELPESLISLSLGYLNKAPLSSLTIPLLTEIISNIDAGSTLTEVTYDGTRDEMIIYGSYNNMANIARGVTNHSYVRNNIETIICTDGLIHL